MSKKTVNKTFLPGDFIFREGEYGKVAYVIEEGDIELVKFTGDDYVTLAEISKGALFGEMAIIDGSPRSGSARAKTSCVLREVSEEQLKQYLSASPQTSLDMMRKLAGYARSANEKLNRDAFESDEKALEFIFNDNQTVGIEENTIPQLLSSWNNHYNSWKRFPKNNILIKYENLILDPKKEILKLTQYLRQFFELSYSDSELNQILYNSSFENLKNLEEKGLFKENALNKDNVTKKFFYLGKKNDWKKLLDKKVSEALEKNFKKEMLELGYL